MIRVSCSWACFSGLALCLTENEDGVWVRGKGKENDFVHSKQQSKTSK